MVQDGKKTQKTIEETYSEETYDAARQDISISFRFRFRQQHRHSFSYGIAESTHHHWTGEETYGMARQEDDPGDV